LAYLNGVDRKDQLIDVMISPFAAKNWIREVVSLDIRSHARYQSMLWYFSQKLTDGCWEARLKEIQYQLSGRQLYFKVGELSIDWRQCHPSQNRASRIKVWIVRTNKVTKRPITSRQAQAAN
jgi:hypothetical protein